MTRAKRWSLLVMSKSPKDINFITPIKERWWLVEMLSLMKRRKDIKIINNLLLHLRKHQWAQLLLLLYYHLATCDPIVFEEAMKDEKWRIAMDEEITLIEKNDTWKLVRWLRGKKSIGVKSIYKDNKNVKEKVERYKAKLMKKSYSQKHWIDYDKIFAHVARLETIQLIIVTATQHR